MWNDRTRLLIGDVGVKVLENSKVCVVGVGGVGGYAASLLARAGVGHLTLVDFDRVDETNINRQIVATTKTVGMLKTDVMKRQILEINPNCDCVAIAERLSEKNIQKIISGFDFVVDAIDSVQDKVDLICFCKQNNIQIVSAMGAGNRVSSANFKVLDVFATFNDGLAKVLRKKLRERGVSSLDVVACDIPPIKLKQEGVVGSISYFPAMCGCVCAGFVIEKLLSKANH